MHVIFVYFVHGGFRTKIKCMRKVQSRSENPQRSATVRKFHAYERSESPGYENWVRTKYSGFTVANISGSAVGHTAWSIGITWQSGILLITLKDCTLHTKFFSSEFLFSFLFFFYTDLSQNVTKRGYVSISILVLQSKVKRYFVCELLRNSFWSQWGLFIKSSRAKRRGTPKSARNIEYIVHAVKWM